MHPGDNVVRLPHASMQVETAALITEHKMEGRKNYSHAVTLLVMFFSSISLLALVYINFPTVAEEHRGKIKMPRSLDDAKDLGTILAIYQESYFAQVTMAYFVVFIFLQTFAIPGSIFLSLLSGALFPFPMALFLVCLCTAIGATNCYYLSFAFGKDLVQAYFPEKLESWKRQLVSHQSSMLNYIIFLRITPFLPNWFINIAAPILDVKITPFFIGTFIGVCPPTLFYIKAGQALQQMTHTGEVMSPTTLIWLVVLGFVALLPILIKRRLASKVD